MHFLSISIQQCLTYYINVYIFLTEYITLAVSISDAPIQQTCNKKQCDMSQMQQQLEAENLLSNQSIYQLVATS